MIIAIDGPAGSGKSSTARAVADRLGFEHLDSGAFYRALTWAALREGLPVDEWPQLDERRIDALGVTVGSGTDGIRPTVLGEDVAEAIRRPEVTANVSAMAQVPAVRDWLLERLRTAATDSNLVADGRDIGTIVFPGADLKIFLVADPVVRARRRLRQIGGELDAVSVAAEVERQAQRDRIDRERSAAPLRPADDAVHLDTSDLSFDEQVTAIVDLARARRGAEQR